jgi:hypothetical protein
MSRTMNRTQLLAAELFNHSYANYQDHLGVNERFDRLIPKTVMTLESAEREGWPLKKPRAGGRAGAGRGSSRTPSRCSRGRGSGESR